MNLNVANHISEIEKVLDGSEVQRDTIVVDSWRRCVNEYGLDPTRKGESYIVPESQLRLHKEKSERVIAVARSGVETLFRQVAGQNYVLLLTDSNGVTVDYFGDKQFESELRQAGLYLGAEWSEERAGTCGVGSCIRTGQALTVHQSDHFDIAHTPLSCTAAPIFDYQGNLQAVLDISLLRSPQPKISQRLAFHLVTNAVRRIEQASLVATMRHEWLLQLSKTPEFLDVDPEAMIALNGSGIIVGLTNTAARIFNQASEICRKDHQYFVGRNISEFIDLSIDDLSRLTRYTIAEERIIFLRNGEARFALANPPPVKHPNRVKDTQKIHPSLENLSGDDAEMRKLEVKATLLAKTELPILIEGETGTGKEVLARAIHHASNVPGPFIALNCGAIPESLIDAELFGHEKGSFTGALSKGKAGLIEASNGGTLFLDEIGEMPLASQTRLLRAIAESEVLRLGSVKPRRVNFRLISATNANLDLLVQTKAFRADLYFRISTAKLELPPLRLRTDIEWLINRIARDRCSNTCITSEAIATLKTRLWPGNIRELENVLLTVSALSNGKPIRTDDLPKPCLEFLVDTEKSRCDIGSDKDLKTMLKMHNGNITSIARELSVNRSTIYRRLKRLGIDPKG
jgi:transcriptional regulator of acetoin/glycerol metabolism